MARKTFPCDIRRAFQQQEKRQKQQQLEFEVSLEDPNLEGLLETCELDTMRVELAGIYRDLQHVHVRAQGWLLAKLEGLTDVEIAERWGTTPSNVWRWNCTYGLAIRHVFAEHLDVSIDLRPAVSGTQAMLQRVSAR